MALRDLWLAARLGAAVLLSLAAPMLAGLVAALGYKDSGASREVAVAVGALVAAAFTLAVLAALCRLWDRRPLRALALGTAESARHLLPGFGLGCLAIATVVAVALFDRHLVVTALNPDRLAYGAALAGLGAALLEFLGVAAGQELVFRGYVLQNLGERLPLWQAVGASAVLFAVVQGLALRLPPPAYLQMALAGALLALLRLATGSLWLPIGFHWAWDFARSGLLSPTLVRAQGPAAGHLLSTPAGLVVPAVLCLLTLLVIARSARRLDWTGKLAEDGARPRLGMLPRVVIRASR